MTARQLAQVFQRRAALVEREFKKTNEQLGLAAVTYCKERMTAEIYAIPETTVSRRKRIGPNRGPLLSKYGKARDVKLWRRTGHLRRAERFELRDAYTFAVVNDAVYAEPRHEAGKPGRRPINPLRESHWRDELAKTFRPIVLEARALTVRDILRAR